MTSLTKVTAALRDLRETVGGPWGIAVRQGRFRVTLRDETPDGTPFMQNITDWDDADGTVAAIRGMLEWA